MYIIRRFTSLLVVGLMLVGLPGASFAKNERKVIDYAVFGDSLAAGQTPYKLIDSGYGEFLKARFEQSQYTVEKYKNFGVSGYTSQQLKRDILEDVETREFIKMAEVITLDIGANDLLGALKQNPAMVYKALQSVEGNLDFILKEIDKLNPDTDVYIMGYYNPFPYLPEEEQENLMPLLATLNDKIELKAKLNGDTFVPTEKVIAKHYAEYLPNQHDIHLSLEGYQTVAKEFWKAIIKNQD